MHHRDRQGSRRVDNADPGASRAGRRPGTKAPTPTTAPTVPTQESAETRQQRTGASRHRASLDLIVGGLDRGRHRWHRFCRYPGPRWRTNAACGPIQWADCRVKASNIERIPVAAACLVAWDWWVTYPWTGSGPIPHLLRARRFGHSETLSVRAAHSWWPRAPTSTCATWVRATSIDVTPVEGFTDRYERVRLTGPGPMIELVCGAVTFTGLTTARLVRGLPPVLVVDPTAEEWSHAALSLIANESRTPRPGSDVVTTRNWQTSSS